MGWHLFQLNPEPRSRSLIKLLQKLPAETRQQFWHAIWEATASNPLDHYAIIGELALEGHTRPVKGGLSIAIEAAKDAGLRGIVLPAENAGESAVVEGLDVIPVESLAQAVAFFAGEIDIAPAPSRLEQLFDEFSLYDVDFGDVRGQEAAKRAVTLAAAGRHNLIMIGPPGSGELGDMEMAPS